MWLCSWLFFQGENFFFSTFHSNEEKISVSGVERLGFLGPVGKRSAQPWRWKLQGQSDVIWTQAVVVWEWINVPIHSNGIVGPKTGPGPQGPVTLSHTSSSQDSLISASSMGKTSCFFCPLRQKIECWMLLRHLWTHMNSKRNLFQHNFPNNCDFTARVIDRLIDHKINVYCSPDARCFL